MRKKLLALLTFMFLTAIMHMIPVQAGSADITLRSFSPEDDYENFMECSVFSGDDLSAVMESVSKMTVTACSEDPFILSSDKIFFLQMDWYADGQPQTESAYHNIHFSIDTNVPGRYELTGKIMVPDGFRLAEGLQIPTVHVTINILPTDEKREIVNLDAVTPLSSLLNPEIVYKDDENYISDLQSSAYSQWLGLTSDLTQAAVLDINWNFSSVDISREGSYPVTLTLTINEEYEDCYYIADENTRYTKTIYVVHRENWNFFITTVFPDFFVADLSRTPAIWNDLEVYYLVSETPLAEDSITYDPFIPCDTPGFVSLVPGSIRINRSQLHLNKYYYFYFKAEGKYSSNIICILDDGTNVEYSSMEGNRDGGDSTETPDTPQISQPAPPVQNGSGTPPAGEVPQQQPGDETPADNVPSNPPAGTTQEKPEDNTVEDEAVPDSDPQSADNTETNPEESKDSPEENTLKDNRKTSGTSSALPSEKVEKGVTEISGSRLSYLYRIYGDYIPFTGENITIKIPASFLKDLDIRESDILTVEIKESDSLSFRLRILVNNKEISLESGIKATMRINGQPLPDTLYLGGQKTDIVITEINGYASFEIPSCGFYELKYRENAPQKSLPIRKSAPAALLLAAAAVVPAAYILRSKRKQVKNKI